MTRVPRGAIGVRALALTLVLMLVGVTVASAQERYFPETDRSVRDAFLDFFEQNGGVDIFGYPRTGEFDQDGRWVQYFQRARFEWWPENPPGHQVQLGLLAVELGKGRPPSGQSADPSRRYFRETQHSIGGGFRQFWETRGGLAVFGYPITEELSENGRTVQYFQRARLEWHGENRPEYRVQLGLLGDELIALGKVRMPAEAAPGAPLAGTGAPAGPGKLLVSVGIGDDFYLMNPDGSALVKLGRGVDPSISPDGTKVAYGLWDTPQPGLYVLDVATGESRRVHAGERVRGPVFSPTMEEIAFYEVYGCFRVIRGRRLPEEGDCQRVKTVSAGGGTDWLVPGQSQWALSPTWGPDGKRIIFKDEKALFVASRTEDARQLSKFEPRYAMPAWSPRGGQVAVQLDMNRDHFEIALVPDDGGTDQRLITQSPPFANPPVTNLSPAWSPDGSRIAYVSDRDGKLAVWTMAADGSGAVKVRDLPIVSQGVFERFVSWGGR